MDKAEPPTEPKEHEEIQEQPEPRKRQGQPLGGLVLLMLLPLVGGVLGYFFSVLVTYVQPKKFESIALVQIHPPGRNLDPFGGESGQLSPGESFTPQFFANEARVFHAEKTLQRVVERLDLTARWDLDPDSVLAVLDTIVVVEPIEGTDLVEIRAHHPSAEAARDVAEKVVEAYKERRTSLMMDRAQMELASLDGELRDQEDLTEEKRKVLDTIAQAIGVPSEAGQEGDYRTSMAKESYARVVERLMELREEKRLLEVESGELLKLENGALLRHALGAGRGPAGLRELMREHQIEKKVLASYEESGMSDWDDQLVRQRAKVEVLAKEIQETVLGLRDDMQIRLRILNAQLEAMSKEVSQMRERAVDASLEAHDYAEAKAEYEEALNMLQTMKREFHRKRIALRIPITPLTVHREPRLAHVPVHPNVGGNLATGVVAGAALGLIMAILIGLVRGMSSTKPVPDDEWA